MASGVVLVEDGGVTRLHHVAIAELHRLRALAAQLAGNHHLHTLGARLHDEAHDTVARAADGEAAQQLVLQGVSLGLRGQAAVGHTLGEQLHGALGEAEALADHRRELADALALVAQHILGARGAHDDLRAHGRIADLNAGVARVDQLTGEQLVHLGEQNAVRDELALLVDTGCCKRRGRGVTTGCFVDFCRRPQPGMFHK